MNFKKIKLPGVIVIEPMIFGDDRGYFFESFNQFELENFIGRKIQFCQDNESKSTYGVLRGLHFQKPPFAQSKLVRVIEGKVLDVIVDLREDSETFGEKFMIELDDRNKKQLFIPRGFAHGFVVLSETAIFSYKVDNYYAPSSEEGLMFNDEKLNINWIIGKENIQLSDKDKNNKKMNTVYKFKGELYD